MISRYIFVILDPRARKILTQFHNYIISYIQHFVFIFETRETWAFQRTSAPLDFSIRRSENRLLNRYALQTSLSYDEQFHIAAEFNPSRKFPLF